MKAKPFVTVSREAGSGGKLVAEKVANALGFTFYDEALLELIANKTKKRKEIIAKLDEKERDFLNEVIHRLLDDEYLSKQTYIKSLCQVIKALSLRGKCVILGRGANFITSRKNGLHVRVIAPFLVREFYTSKYEGYPLPVAKERVRKFDRDRKEFVRQYFGKNPSNANYYDLVLNTQQLTIDQAVEAVLTAFRVKFKTKSLKDLIPS